MFVCLFVCLFIYGSETFFTRLISSPLHVVARSSLPTQWRRCPRPLNGIWSQTVLRQGYRNASGCLGKREHGFQNVNIKLEISSVISSSYNFAQAFFNSVAVFPNWVRQHSRESVGQSLGATSGPECLPEVHSFFNNIHNIENWHDQPKRPPSNAMKSVLRNIVRLQSKLGHSIRTEWFGMFSEGANETKSCDWRAIRHVVHGWKRLSASHL